MEDRRTSSPADYCRQIETYLCRKNEGHLVRIVGPAFERVCGWAGRGVPLKIVYRGIDRYCERYYAKGPKRRPVRIEFCEADILDAFDEWRRAIGVGTSGEGGESQERTARRPSLAEHIGRVIARLTAIRAEGRSEAFAAAIARAVEEMDRVAGEARHARGDARTRIVARLGEIDRALMMVALRDVDESTAASLRAEAASELASFRGRMATEAWSAAAVTAFERLVRENIGIPIVAYE